MPFVSTNWQAVPAAFVSRADAGLVLTQPLNVAAASTFLCFQPLWVKSGLPSSAWRVSTHTALGVWPVNTAAWHLSQWVMPASSQA